MTQLCLICNRLLPMICWVAVLLAPGACCTLTPCILMLHCVDHIQLYNVAMCKGKTLMHADTHVRICRFRLGGMAAVLSNRRSDGKRAKYQLQHLVRTHVGDDQAYRYSWSSSR